MLIFFVCNCIIALCSNKQPTYCSYGSTSSLHHFISAVETGLYDFPNNIMLPKPKNHAGVVTLGIFRVDQLVCRVHLHNFVALLEFSGHWPSVWWFYVFSLYAGGIEEWGYGLTSKLSWAELSDCFLAVLVQHMWFRVTSNMVVISHRKALQPAGLIIQSPD